MSDARNENEMDTPATQGQLQLLRGELHDTEQRLRGEIHAVRDELVTKIAASHADTIHHMGALKEEIIASVAALFDPHQGLPERVVALEVDVTELKARRTRRRS